MADLKSRTKKRALLSLAKGALWAYEAPRRYIPHTIVGDFIGFPDSGLDLGQEQIPPHEKEFVDRALELLIERHKRGYPPGARPMPRDFHGKTHGCLSATFTVERDLPGEMRYGVFAEARAFPAVVRFSNASRDIGSDRIPNQHGLAIKVLLDDGRHQDFLLSDYPVNLVKDAEEGYYFYRAEASNKPVTFLASNPRSGVITYLSAFGSDARDLFELSYFSQTPYRLGPKRACKYIVRPPNWDGRAPPSSPLPDHPDFLREQMQTRIREAEASGKPIVLDFYVQPQRHPVRQPIENASFRWDEGEAIPVKVATLELRPSEEIPFTSPEAQWHAERIAFSPKNALADHAPLGGVNRMRLAIYDKLAKLRHDANGVTELRGHDAAPPLRRERGADR